MGTLEVKKASVCRGKYLPAVRGVGVNGAGVCPQACVHCGESLRAYFSASGFFPACPEYFCVDLLYIHFGYMKICSQVFKLTALKKRTRKL